MGLTYKDAGVDIEAGDALVERIKPFAARTLRPEVVSGVGGFGGLEIVGTADEIADTMQSWLETGAADGFNIMFPTVPAGLDDFVALVIPELQRRGIFREDYDGTTLREHFGLPRPENQFFPRR